MSRTPVPCHHQAAHGVGFHWAGTADAIACVPGQRVSGAALAGMAFAASASPEDVELLERVNAPQFHALLARRNAQQEQFDTLREAAKVAKNEGNGAQIRALSQAAREAYFALVETKAAVDEYKNATAELLADYAPEDGYDHVASPERIGSLVEVGQWESNSEDWLLGRRRGIGGSDVGKLYSKKTEALKEFVANKAGPWTPGETTDAMQRGNYWEAKIADSFRNAHPEYETTLAKSSYRSEKHRWQVVNLDGLLTRAGEDQPSGVLECKTGVPQYWENGVPLDYRAQMLHYLDATGLDYGYVAAMLDDHDFRTYRIERGEPIDPEDPTSTYDNLRPYLEQAWGQVEDARAVGLPESAEARKFDFKHGDTSIAQVAAFNGISLEQAQSRFDEVMGQLKHIKTKKEREDTAYRQLLADGVNPEARFAYLDLETTNYVPETGEIIEIGIEVRNGRGEVLDRHEEVFGIDPRFAAVRGTGMEEVHNISLEETRGKRTFKEAAEDISRVLGLDTDRPATVVAHNAKFERNWLDANLAGYHEARTEGRMAEMDTMWLTQRAVHSAKRNNLASFVEAMGGQYTGAHRAMRDTQMTADATEELRRRVAESGDARV